MGNTNKNNQSAKLKKAFTFKKPKVSKPSKSKLAKGFLSPRAGRRVKKKEFLSGFAKGSRFAGVISPKGKLLARPKVQIGV